MINRMKLNMKKDHNKFLFLLLSADCLFIILHIFHDYTGFFVDPRYAISKDRGFGEIFQYVKEYWVSLIFFWLAVKNRSLLYLSYSLLFVYILVDDSFMIHEKLGKEISIYFGFPTMLKLRPRDFGEMSIYAIVGLSFLFLVGLTYPGSTQNLKKTCRKSFVFLAIFFLFGAVIDMATIMIANIFSKNSLWYSLIILLEDGGEMIIVSVILWYVFLLLGEERSDHSAVVSENI